MRRPIPALLVAAAACGRPVVVTAVTASRGRAGNFEFRDRGVWTALWRKRNGGWRIVHDHTSTSGGG